MSENTTIGEYLTESFTRLWEMEREFGRIKNARIFRNGDIIECECIFRTFSLNERKSLGNHIPLDGRRCSFKMKIMDNDIIEIDNVRYNPKIISILPWGDISEYVTLLTSEGGEQ